MYDEELIDVTVLGEVNEPIGDNHDDCVVLDGDPKNQVKYVNDSPARGGEFCVGGDTGKLFSSLISFCYYLKKMFQIFFIVWIRNWKSVN